MKKAKYLSLLLLAMTLIVVSCKKKKDQEVVPEPEVVSINSSLRTSFKLDGTAVFYGESTADFYASTGYSGSTGGGAFHKNYSSFVGLFNDVGLTISKGILTVPTGSSFPPNATFKNFFVAGNYNFSPSYDSTGIIIEYNDGTDTWSTKLGSGNQTGSSFKIVESRNELASPYTMKVYVTFNCKLYSFSTGAVKTVTDGVFVGGYENL